jgi:hypothetical protein
MVFTVGLAAKTAPAGAHCIHSGIRTICRCERPAYWPVRMKDEEEMTA